MSELPPTEFSGEEPRTRFLCPRDAILYDLALNGWAQASSGDVGAPSGHFSRISNSTVELDDVIGALDIPFELYGVADPNELVGHFLVGENNLGFVDVEEFETEEQLDYAYSILEDIYIAWDTH